MKPSERVQFKLWPKSTRASQDVGARNTVYVSQTMKMMVGGDVACFKRKARQHSIKEANFVKEGRVTLLNNKEGCFMFRGCLMTPLSLNEHQMVVF